MPKKKTSPIYLLPEYANSDNLEHERYREEEVSTVKFSDKSLTLKLTESNSLVEERYCLNIESAKYELEGTMSRNEIKEAMIHHHPQGHPWKHLQFKMSSKSEVIRVNLEPVDEEDYEKCIKGFLHISQDIIRIEQEENRIGADLISYFFNKKIGELSPFRGYLLRKIKTAYENGGILGNSNEPIDSQQLEGLKSEKLLLPFLNWQ